MDEDLTIEREREMTKFQFTMETKFFLHLGEVCILPSCYSVAQAGASQETGGETEASRFVLEVLLAPFGNPHGCAKCSFAAAKGIADWSLQPSACGMKRRGWLQAADVLISCLSHAVPSHAIQLAGSVAAGLMLANYSAPSRCESQNPRALSAHT